MQTLQEQIYGELARRAKQRGVTVQELIRAVVVPEWIRSEEPARTQTNSSTVARPFAELLGVMTRRRGVEHQLEAKQERVASQPSVLLPSQEKALQTNTNRRMYKKLSGE